MESRTKMRILVTGNLGYVGSHLTQLLVNSGHNVTGCDLSLFPDAICSDLVKPHAQLTCDFRALSTSELTHFDAIAHLAGISNDPMGELNPGLTLKINGQGSVDLAQTAKLAGVKIFAFASSCSLYGSAGDQPRIESDSTNPLSEYAASKLFAEEGLINLASQIFSVYILRNATAYGSSPVFRTDLVVNDLSAGMCAQNTAEIRSDGSPWRPLIHCLDMARAFQLFIESDPKEVSGSPVNVGFTEENFQVRDIGRLVQEVWPDGLVHYLPNAQSDPRDYKVNFERLKTIFPEFSPVFPLSKGILDLRKHLEQMKYSEHERDAKRYVRLNELKKRIEELE